MLSTSEETGARTALIDRVALLADQFLSAPTVARLFGVSVRTLGNWVSRGVFPMPHVLPGGRAAWRESEIREFVQDCERDPS